MEPLWIQKESAVLKTLSKSASLRTTIPSQVVDFLKVAPGDKLEWNVRIQDDGILVFVRKKETVV